MPGDHRDAVKRQNLTFKWRISRAPRTSVRSAVLFSEVMSKWDNVQVENSVAGEGGNPDNVLSGQCPTRTMTKLNISVGRGAVTLTNERQQDTRTQIQGQTNISRG